LSKPTFPIYPAEQAQPEASVAPAGHGRNGFGADHNDSGGRNTAIGPGSGMAPAPAARMSLDSPVFGRPCRCKWSEEENLIWCESDRVSGLFGAAPWPLAQMGSAIHTQTH
jgi:hypothetical protein